MLVLPKFNLPIIIVLKLKLRRKQANCYCKIDFRANMNNEITEKLQKKGGFCWKSQTFSQKKSNSASISQNRNYFRKKSATPTPFSKKLAFGKKSFFSQMATRWKASLNMWYISFWIHKFELRMEFSCWQRTNLS